MLHLKQMKFLIGQILGLVITTALLTACSGENSSDSSLAPPPNSSGAGTTVRVSVNANDPDRDQLHYRWAVTDGTIENVDARTTNWTVPRGSGLQFVYVVVSDNKGGFTEQRAAGLTFDPPTLTSTASPALITPPTPTGARGFVWGSVFSESYNRNVYLPGVTVRLSNGKSAVTDMKGQFFIPNVPDGEYEVKYTIPGQSEVAFPSNKARVRSASNIFPTSPSASDYFKGKISPPPAAQVAGSVRLADHTFCGIRNEFFSHSSVPNLFLEPESGSAQLFSEQGEPLSARVRINHYGDYFIVPNQPGTSAKVRISCGAEIRDSDSFTLPATGAIKRPLITLQNHRPIVESMIVNSEDDSRPDLPKPRTLFKSVNGTPPTFGDEDLIAEIIHTPGDDAFFTYKGIDTRKSACKYYSAIGAVEGCTADGFPTGAQLTLAQWRNKFKLSTFSNGDSTIPSDPDDGQELRLQYVNRSDLNLTRDMQAIKHSNGDIAYNVCNYPGPLDVNDPDGRPKEIGAETQPDINFAIDNARQGIGMIVCVAMDYQVKDGFTRFYTFGPTGKLLLSVSLDGRREKFLPGSCTTCHGGDAYGGQFPDDGSGRPDLQSRWLPFDIENFRFSTSQDRDKANRIVKAFNQRMISTELSSITTDRTKKLIGTWYEGGRVDQNQDIIPPGSPTNDPTIYKKVVQPACQTCHAALKVPETLSNATMVCGASKTLEQNRSMTIYSFAPFERYWFDPTIPPLLNLGCNDKPLKHPSL